jgi:peptidoglycan/LPS O-acetylase OafA/YrhL
MVPRRWVTIGGAFDSRANSIGFFRWLLAFAVIFSHAGPIGGFYGGKDLGVQISDEQSLGGVAVGGFFFFSGFLITRSRWGSGTLRYFWRRCLRIMPAFWAALLVTGFVLAPLAWIREKGSIAGFWSAEQDSPLTYVWQNMFLVLDQRNIAGMGESVPYAQLGGYDWNGSAWTLSYEFKAYLAVGVIGLLGVAASRWVGTAFALTVIIANSLMWAGAFAAQDIGTFLAEPFGRELLTDRFNLMLLAPFAFGMLVAMWGHLIPLHGGLALVALAGALVSYDLGNWNVVGQYGLLYALMWAAIRWTRVRNWERFGDFSYGVYIFAWPLMTFAAFFGLHEQGMLVYFLVLVTAVHAVAFASWHLIEKPAMSLKNWSPSWPGRSAARASLPEATNPTDASTASAPSSPDDTAAPASSVPDPPLDVLVGVSTHRTHEGRQP